MTASLYADRSADLQSDLAFFSDGMAGRLHPSVGREDLPRFRSEVMRSVAARMLAGSYEAEARRMTVSASPSPRVLEDILKLGNGFSRYEPITGMVLEPGEHVVLVEGVGERPLRLRIPDWMRQPPAGIDPARDPAGWGLKEVSYPLKEGVNLLRVEKGGNAYLDFVTEDPKEIPRVQVHFLTGQVNGIFDASRHTNADWDRLLDAAVSPILDARGRYIQVAYPVEWLQTFARGRGVELIQSYDRILHHHYTFLGLVKYNKVPPNRILARVNYNYYMFRDGDGVAYLGDRSTMAKVVDPEAVVRGDPCWGFSHEVGHVLQMRPQITWGGMTEVSCNLFSMYTTTQLGNPSRLQQGGTYEAARRNIVEASPRPSYLAVEDVFQRLVPFWQLHLYFSRTGRPAFYADVMEAMRRRPDAGRGNASILNQFDFIRICCEVARMDLTDFFEQWGFFWTGSLTVQDYGTYQFTIEPETVERLKAEIAALGYPPPPHDVTRVTDAWTPRG